MKPAVAYIVSRFPKITETFILYEMNALESRGMRVELYPLLLQDEAVQHDEARAWVARAHSFDWFSLEALGSQIYWLLRNPGAYLGTWWRALWGNRASIKFLLRAPAAIYLGACFARHIQASEVKHVHAHWATHAALAAYTVHRLTGLPYSFTAHAHDIYVDRSMLGEKIRRAAFVVTISDYNKAFLERHYGPQASEKTHVVHCGVDTQVFSPPDNANENATFNIVCVAGLERKKGHRYLIEACQLLKREGLDFRCLLVGDGPERPAIETQIAALALQNEVHLLGRLPQGETRRQMASADAVVLPSVRLDSGKQEGIPVALMEALAMGLPAIASDISGVPELIEDGHSGLLVPERDPRALADAILRLQRERGLGERLGKAGRQKVLEAFDLHSSAARLEQLFTQATSPGLTGGKTAPDPGLLREQT